MFNKEYYTTGCVNRKGQNNNWNRRCRGFLDKLPNNSEKGSQNLFILIFSSSNETHTSCLVKNTIPQAVWIEKDRRTIGTGDESVFLIRGPTIQKKGNKSCSYCGIIFFTKQLACVSLEKKRNQYKQVLAPFFWNVENLIKKNPALPVPIVLLSFSFQTASYSILHKTTGLCFIRRRKNQYEQVLAPFFWIIGPLIKKTHALPVRIVLLSFSIQTACGKYVSLNSWCVFH